MNKREKPEDQNGPRRAINQAVVDPKRSTTNPRPIIEIARFLTTIYIRQ